MKIIEETLLVKTSTTIAIIISRFNHFINQHLLNGALNSLQRIGQVKLENISVIYVPGSYEIPITANILAQKKQHDAIITLGTIIKGDTSHYLHIFNTVSFGLSKISVNNNIPITLGIIIANNIEQAIERSGTKLGNKGSEAALTALEMINVINTIHNI